MAAIIANIAIVAIIPSATVDFSKKLSDMISCFYYESKLKNYPETIYLAIVYFWKKDILLTIF